MTGRGVQVAAVSLLIEEEEVWKEENIPKYRMIERPRTIEMLPGFVVIL